jgi:hypothetical protein
MRSQLGDQRRQIAVHRVAEAPVVNGEVVRDGAIMVDGDARIHRRLSWQSS